jgi:hypothetical protein
MKFYPFSLSSGILIVASLLAASTTYAATIPGSITAFDAAKTNGVFVVGSKSWSDPAFGNAGWTHKSNWGTFHAEKGQIVSINLRAADVGIHPAASVWFRGANDTAPDNYVVDHFYVQNADLIKMGATDEGTSAKIGNIVMEHIIHGYDLDNNTAKVKKLNGKLDKIAGRLVLNVKIPYTGDYMFAVSGFNPDSNIDTTKDYTINVTVKVK